MTFGPIFFFERSWKQESRVDTFTATFSFRSKAFDQELYKVCRRKEISVSISMAAKKKKISTCDTESRNSTHIGHIDLYFFDDPD